jgi:polyketide cyclase/dehydrase/lipid transport protein
LHFLLGETVSSVFLATIRSFSQFSPNATNQGFERRHKKGDQMTDIDTTRLCQPTGGLPYCFEVTVFIAGPPEALWFYLGDMEKMSEFFPSVDFKRERSGPLKVGEKYFSKLSFRKHWTGYMVLAVVANKRLSAQQVGKFLFVNQMRYDHQLIAVEGGCLSREKVEYSLSGGWFAPVLNWLFAGRMLRKLNRSAHLELKRRVEMDTIT